MQTATYTNSWWLVSWKLRLDIFYCKQYTVTMKLYGLHITDSLKHPNSMQSWLVRAEDEAEAKIIVSKAATVLPNPLITKVVEVDDKYYNETLVPNGTAVQII